MSNVARVFLFLGIFFADSLWADVIRNDDNPGKLHDGVNAADHFRLAGFNAFGFGSQPRRVGIGAHLGQSGVAAPRHCKAAG